MSRELIGLIGIVVMLILMFSGMWIATAMALVGFVGYIILAGLDNALNLLGMLPYNNVASYSYTAIPLFIFMGNLVSVTGIGQDLFGSAYRWFGRLPGGLGISTIGASAGFAAVCGSDVASIMTMANVALPVLKKHGYDDALSTGCVVSGGTLGLLIPPSLAFILYGILTENSVSALFMAGILPGVLMVVLFSGLILFWTLRNPNAGPPGPSTTFMEKLASLKGVWMMIALFLLVLGGLYFGIFTATEAGAIGTVGAIIITVVTRRLSLQHLMNSIYETGITTCMVIFIIIGAFIFMRFLAISRLPMWMATWVAELNMNRYVVFAVIVLFYLVCGMFLEIFSAIMFTIPIIYPLILALGFDPIWFGVVVVILIEMGLITPPVGLGVYCLSSVTDVPIPRIFKGALPFAVLMLIAVIILVIFPEIALLIPGRMK